MNRNFIFAPFVFCLMLNVQAFGQSENGFVKKSHLMAGGGVLLYNILMPENFDASKKYPLVLFLHGAGERGNDNEKQLIHGSKMFLEPANRKDFSSIVVFPQCPQGESWGNVKADRSKNPLSFSFNYDAPSTPAMELVMDLLNNLIMEGNVDTRRVYVMGLSMGGFGTFEMVYRQPDLFAAAAPICGGGDDIRYDTRVKKTVFWVFHGDADPVVHVDLSRIMVKKLESLKGKVKYTEYPGVGHNSWDHAFAEKEFLSWMFSQKRKK